MRTPSGIDKGWGEIFGRQSNAERGRSVDHFSPMGFQILFKVAFGVPVDEEGRELSWTAVFTDISNDLSDRNASYWDVRLKFIPRVKMGNALHDLVDILDRYPSLNYNVFKGEGSVGISQDFVNDHFNRINIALNSR